MPTDTKARSAEKDEPGVTERDTLVRLLDLLRPLTNEGRERVLGSVARFYGVWVKVEK